MAWQWYCWIGIVNYKCMRSNRTLKLECEYITKHSSSGVHWDSSRRILRPQDSESSLPVGWHWHWHFWLHCEFRTPKVLKKLKSNMKIIKRTCTCTLLYLGTYALLRRWTWTGDFKCREVKTGFYRNRSMQTGSSGTLIGWKSGQTTFVPLWDWMEGPWLRTLLNWLPCFQYWRRSVGR